MFTALSLVSKLLFVGYVARYYEHDSERSLENVLDFDRQQD